MKTKNQNGITLIALVITIIILLIIAGVAISMVIGDNGILGQATTASTNTNNTSEKEQVEMALTAATSRRFAGDIEHIDARVIKEELEKMQLTENTDFTVLEDSSKLIISFIKSGNEYIIDGDIVTPKYNSNLGSSVENGVVKNITKNIEYASIIEAVNNSADNDIIEVSGGEYNLIEEMDFTSNGAAVVIDKSITIKAKDASNKPILILANSDGTTVPAIINGIEIKADNVCMENIILKIAEGETGSGNLLKISAENSASNEFYEDVIIDGCEFYGSDHSIEIYAKNALIQNCIFDESNAADQGNIMFIRGVTEGLKVINNSFIGCSQKKHAVSFYGENNNYIQGDILFENNTFNQVYKCIVHESTMIYDNVSIQIKNNIFNDYKKKAVAIDKGSFIEYVIIGNIFEASNDGTVIVDNGINFYVEADSNYWGTDAPDRNAIFEGNVNATKYYTSVEKSNLATW